MFRTYRKLEQGEQIVVGADTAAGGRDYCAAQFISKKNIDVPLVYHKRVLATEMTNELYPKLNEIYDITGIKPTIAYERNNGGLFEMERLASLNRAGKFNIYQMSTYGVTNTEETAKLGWDTNTATRPKMLSDLKEAIDKRVLRVYDKPTIDEMYSFIIVQTSSAWKAQAEQGGYDDLVMSLAISWQMYQNTRPPVDLRNLKFPEMDYDDITGIPI